MEKVGIPLEFENPLGFMYKLVTEHENGNLKIDNLSALEVDIFLFINDIHKLFSYHNRINQEYKLPTQPGYDLKLMLENLVKLNKRIPKLVKDIIKISLKINIHSDDIARYYEKLLEEQNLMDAYFFSKNQLKTTMSYSKHLNIYGDSVGFQHLSFNIISQMPHQDRVDTQAGRLISDEVNQIYKLQMWDLINSILSFKQLISDESSMTNIHLQFMECWLYLFKLLDSMGCTDDSIFGMFNLTYNSNENK